MSFAAFLLPCGEARRGAKPSRLPVSSYSSRTKGQDREANLSPIPRADLQRISRRNGRGQLASSIPMLRLFYSGPERSGVCRLAICHAAFHVGAYATGNAAVESYRLTVRHLERRRIHQIRSLKFHPCDQAAKHAHGDLSDGLKALNRFVSFTGLSVFHDRNSSEGTNGNVQKHDGKIRHVEC